MRRVVVIGGTGCFGRAAVTLLRQEGIAAVVAARRSAALSVDVEDPASLRRLLQPGDVVFDAAGPFRARTSVLVEAAIEVGFDVVDIADAAAYVRNVMSFAEDARAAGVRLLPACSTSAAVTSAMIGWSALPEPVRLTAFLVPSTRHTAAGATAASLFASVGRSVEVLRDGRLIVARGFTESIRLPEDFPFGPRRGWLFETADGLLLPASHPTLATVEWYVAPNVPGLGSVLALAAHVEPIRAVVKRMMAAALPLVRRLGRQCGGLGCELEDASGAVMRMVIFSSHEAFRLAVIPGVLAVSSLARDEMKGRGIIPPHCHVDPEHLLRALRKSGFALVPGVNGVTRS